MSKNRINPTIHLHTTQCKSIWIRTLALILFTSPALIMGQNTDLETLTEQIIGYETLQELNHTIEILEQKLALDSNNAKASLLLAYAYTRQTSNKGSSLHKFTFNTTHFEKINSLLRKVRKLEPGAQLPSLLGGANAEILLASQWADLSLSYKINNKPDSAQWILQQPGVKEDFSPFWLSVNRNKLQSCDSNSLLFVMGRNFYPFLYYIQEVEQIRTDVSVVDIFHLIYYWYLNYLNTQILPDPSWYSSDLDSLNYLPWTDTTLYIQNSQTQETFAWNMQPSYLDKYIIRDQIILLELVQFYAFKHPLYFSSFIDNASFLSLNTSCANKVWVKELNLQYNANLHSETYTLFIENPLGSTLQYYNPHIPLQHLMLDAVREEVIRKSGTEAALGNTETATQILKTLEKVMPIETYPISAEFEHLQMLLQNISRYLKSE